MEMTAEQMKTTLGYSFWFTFDSAEKDKMIQRGKSTSKKVRLLGQDGFIDAAKSERTISTGTITPTL